MIKNLGGSIGQGSMVHHNNRSGIVWQVMKRIAFGVRVMETIGLSLSLISLCVSVLIFFRFRLVFVVELVYIVFQYLCSRKCS